MSKFDKFEFKFKSKQMKNVDVKMQNAKVTQSAQNAQNMHNGIVTHAE